MHRVLGILLGLFLAAAVLLLAGRQGASARSLGPILSECDSSLRSLVIHYVSDAAYTLPVYRAFLGQLPPQVTVHVVCPDSATYNQLLSQLGPLRCTLRPIIANHPITAWSRDRWVARQSPGGASLLSPRGEAGAEIWPTRAGDQRVAFDIASAMPSSVSAEKSDLYFDGGDFLADAENVFVAPSVVSRNVQQTVPDETELRSALLRSLKKNIVFLRSAPDHHVGMYMASVGNRTALVGDPSLARAFPHADLPGGPDFSAETQRRFDAVAAQLADLGYRVIRIPTLLSPDGKTYFTYVNGILDRRPGRRIVYMPTYQGCQAMNAAAQSTWAGLGYEVHPVDCTSTYRLFGNLHCLINVLERGT